jgi:hypothetical protein
MGSAARERASELVFTPEEFAERMSVLVERALEHR